jgi:hypothetical protein
LELPLFIIALAGQQGREADLAGQSAEREIDS